MREPCRSSRPPSGYRSVIVPLLASVKLPALLLAATAMAGDAILKFRDRNPLMFLRHLCRLVLVASIACVGFEIARDMVAYRAARVLPLGAAVVDRKLRVVE